MTTVPDAALPASTPPAPTPSAEGRTGPQTAGVQAKLNWLRAGVLGANDGVVSVAGLVIGVAAATTDRKAIFISGIAALSAGAVSMALGEYVSVSSQRDTELAMIERERRELAEDPEGELDELAELYEHRGLSPALARQVAEELTEKDALSAHVHAELGLDSEERTNPWHAALASFLAFTVGALLPLVAMVLAPADARVWVTFVAALGALMITGTVSAHLGEARRRRAVVRLVVGGALAMLATWAIGGLFGATVTG